MSNTDTIFFVDGDADDEYEFYDIPDLVWEQVDEIAWNELNGTGGEWRSFFCQINST